MKNIQYLVPEELFAQLPKPSQALIKEQGVPCDENGNPVDLGDDSAQDDSPDMGAPDDEAAEGHPNVADSIAEEDSENNMDDEGLEYMPEDERNATKDFDVASEKGMAALMAAQRNPNNPEGGNNQVNKGFALKKKPLGVKPNPDDTDEAID